MERQGEEQVLEFKKKAKTSESVWHMLNLSYPQTPEGCCEPMKISLCNKGSAEPRQDASTWMAFQMMVPETIQA
jgi:hypothetical protein